MQRKIKLQIIMSIYIFHIHIIYIVYSIMYTTYKVNNANIRIEIMKIYNYILHDTAIISN